MNTEIEARFIGNRYILIKDLTVYTDYFGERKIFTIPAGFNTDFASIPRLLWSFVSPTDEFIRIPSLIHDYLYQTKWYPRHVCDAIFLEKMLSFGYKSTLKSFLVYIAVRLFGWFRFKNK